MKQFLSKGKASVLWQKQMNNLRRTSRPGGGPPGPDEVAAADIQDEDQRHPCVPTPLPEVPLPQVEEEIPVDRRKEVAPPPVEVAEATSQRPGPVSRGGPGQASLDSETGPARGMRNTQADRLQRPERTRKKLSKFDN